MLKFYLSNITTLIPNNLSRNPNSKYWCFMPYLYKDYFVILAVKNKMILTPFNNTGSLKFQVILTHFLKDKLIFSSLEFKSCHFLTE